MTRLCYNLTDMEPRHSGPGASLENTPTPSVGGEGYSLPEVMPGVGPERGHEVLENVPAPIELPHAPPTIPVVPVPIPQDDDNTTVIATQPISDAPVSAADEDLIEKEWVDKAKKIIEDTKDDPYKRELEIGRLQREYIKKRYGREIGASGEQ